MEIRNYGLTGSPPFLPAGIQVGKASEGALPAGTMPASAGSEYPAADRVDIQDDKAGLPRDPGDSLLQGPVEKVPLSLADRISLNGEKKQVAQAYYQVGRELAHRVTGSADSFKYRGVGLTNIDEVASLWSLQAKHGDKGTTLRSIPVTIGAMALGAINNVPIEGAKLEGGKLTEARASGHNFNPLINTASVIAAGAALTMVPGLVPLALAGPILTAATLAVQRFGDTNAPVHEMAHGMQFLLVGDLLNRGMIDESDFMAIQNDSARTGYLWGGETEKAARAAEKTGDIRPVFDVIRKRVAMRLEDRYSMGAQPVIQEAEKLLDEHQEWITKELDRHLQKPQQA